MKVISDAAATVQKRSSSGSDKQKHGYLDRSPNSPLYNGKFILKIISEVISEDRYFSQMYCMLMCCADKIINSVNCLNPVADS
jgi:hypothetical protein